MRLLDTLKTTPIWLMLPSFVVASAIAMTVVGYTPLVFDPSLYQTESALADELKQVDADELESGNSENVGGAGATGKMKDGTWTGYAVCGEGNSDGWSPYYVAVTIQVKDNKVTGITNIAGSSTGNDGSAALNWDAAENQEYLDLAVSGRGGSGVRAQMESQIASSGTVSGIDTVSGATYSSVAIYNAFVDATKKAAGESGSVAGAASTGDSGASKKVKGASSSAELADGTWIGYAACGLDGDVGWSPYYVAVTVKVKGGKPKGITKVVGSSTGSSGDQNLSWDASENQKYLSWAISGKGSSSGVKTQINRQLKANGSVSGIDTVSGATYSSEAIYAAYQDALAKSAKAAGSKSKTKRKKSSGNNASTAPTPVDVGDGSVVSGALADGTWTGYASCGQGNDEDWSPYYVAVTLRVSGGKVVGIDSVSGSATGDSGDAQLLWNASENQKYLDWAISGRTRGATKYAGVVSQITAMLPAGTSLGNIDAVSGATYSSTSIVKAYYAALRKSAAAAGSSVQEPADGPDAGSSTDSGGSGDSVDSGGGDGDAGQTNPDDPAIEPDKPAKMVNGTYTGYGWCEDPDRIDEWNPYYVVLSIEVEDGAIVEISDVYGDAEGIVDPKYLYEPENIPYLDRAINGTSRKPGVVRQLSSKLDSGSSAAGIDTLSSATFSSRAIVDAFVDAARQAEATAA